MMRGWIERRFRIYWGTTTATLENYAEPLPWAFVAYNPRGCDMTRLEIAVGDRGFYADWGRERP